MSGRPGSPLPHARRPGMLAVYSLRTLHLHLLRQTVATLLVTVAVFTFILLLGNVLKDVLDLLASGRATPSIVMRAILLLIPFAVAFALPIGMLTASLLVFGRLSADGEITAIRSGGISLVAAAAPVVGLSVLLSGVCGWFNGYVAPASRVAFKQLQQEAIRAKGFAGFASGRYLDFGSLTLYAREASGTNLSEVLVYQVVGGRRMLDLWAPEANFSLDSNGWPNHLTLRNAQGLAQLNPIYAAEWSTNLTLLRPDALVTPKPSEMTFPQLRTELERRRGAGEPVTPILVQLHRQVAFSFACVGFTMVGIPLGLRAHRRETNIGLAIALALLFAYYAFIILGQALETREAAWPHLILWIPNFLFQGVGAWMLYRADQGPR